MDPAFKSTFVLSCQWRCFDDLVAFIIETSARAMGPNGSVLRFFENDTMIGMVLPIAVGPQESTLCKESQLKMSAQVRNGWNMDETWMKHGWNMDETWMKHGWKAGSYILFRGSVHLGQPHWASSLLSFQSCMLWFGSASPASTPAICASRAHEIMSCRMK